ncbi:hypothetical protein GALMADRAFT_1344285 [Galerina marginata CBS 339.88]|uniref:F-box domain-containing protein n=1 Tax=Galerina marginata (strain CBS 339.88) TaxID=685588 RepID=A0A067SMB2_GALM3|nr:hypothetical protein GALMADRAFT_1344285 [Galerina marginata CBS 339.88]
MPKSEIPIDIVQNVVENLDNSTDADSLKALALSCKSVLPLCQKRLFSSISLRPKYDSQLDTLSYDSFDRLSQILDDSLHLRAYVRSLEYAVDSGNDTWTVGSIIFKLINLQRLHLIYEGDSYPFDWSSFDIDEAPFTSAVYCAIRRSGFNHLRLTAVENFPLSDFTDRCNSLSIVEAANCSIEITLVEGNGHVLVTAPPYPPRITMFLEKLSVVWWNFSYLSETKKIMELTQGLEFLKIRVLDHTEDASFSKLSAAICETCIGTLTELNVAFLAYVAVQVTPTLCEELERLSEASSVLKRITISVLFDSSYLRYPELDLHRLDSIIATRYSNLETFTLVLETRQNLLCIFEDANILDRFRQQFLQVNTVSKLKFTCILQIC